MKRILVSFLLLLAVASHVLAAKYVVVTATNVCFRSCPDESCKLTGPHWEHMNPGDMFVYLGSVQGYYKICVGDAEVYVPQRYAKLQDAVSPKYVVITGDDVCVRNTPNESGKDCSTKMYWYETYQYLGQSGNYYKISVAGKTCYVPKKYAYLR